MITDEILIELNNFKLKSTGKGDGTLQINSSKHVVVGQKILMLNKKMLMLNKKIL
jgi:hypothetical protein